VTSPHIAQGSDFTLANLPYGVASIRGAAPQVVTRIGDSVVPLAWIVRSVPPDVFVRPSLNEFLALGPDAWAATRAELVEFLREADDGVFTPIDDVVVMMPIEVGDYADFYSSLDHATNVARLFRPDVAEPVAPNWRHLPVGYHGRAGTVVVSGTAVARPVGLVQTERGVERRPSSVLDFELEVGFVVGAGNTLGEPIAADDADRHVFGVVLVNDWSARDIQLFESQPLGPFLAKSFLTTVSPWVVPLEALKPFFVEAPPQDPAPDLSLRTERRWAIDLELAAEINGTTVTRINFRRLYWTFAQQLAHLTSNGALTRPGDLFASGTVSGPDPGQHGCLVESGGPFLEDGDTVTLRGWCGDGDSRVGFGEATGTVHPSREI
jgi:fumarylacetoacetase